LLVTASVVLSSRILSTLRTEATLSSETSVIKTPARCHIPEDGILYMSLNWVTSSHICLNYVTQRRRIFTFYFQNEFDIDFSLCFIIRIGVRHDTLNGLIVEGLAECSLNGEYVICYRSIEHSNQFNPMICLNELLHPCE
jgi:hypothetical protein